MRRRINLSQFLSFYFQQVIENSADPDEERSSGEEDEGTSSNNNNNNNRASSSSSSSSNNNNNSSTAPQNSSSSSTKERRRAARRRRSVSSERQHTQQQPQSQQQRISSSQLLQLLTNATQRNNNNEEEDGDDDDDDDIQILDSSHQHDDDEDEDDLIGASRSRNDMMQDDDDDENNQDDEEDEDDEDDNEDGDYMQQDNEDEDDDDGDDDDDLDYNPIQRVNQQNIQNEMHVQSKLREKMEWEIKRRQTALKDHDFAQTIDLHTGRLDSRSSNVFHALDERSIENKMARKRSSYAKVMQNFIPNQPKGIVDQYDHQIFCGQFSKDGEIYMSACQDQIIRFYRTEEIRQAITQERTAQPFRELPARDVGWSIVDCHYSHDNRFAIYSTWSSFVYLFSIESDTTRTEAMDLEPRSRQMCPFSVRFSADSKEILAGTSDYSLYLYDIEQKKRVYHVEDAHQDDVNTVCFADSTPNIFFSAGDDGVCKVWDRRCFSSDSRSAVGMLVGHTAGITYLDSKGDGRYFITNGKDQVMKLWDIRRMKTPDSGDIPKISIPRDWDYRWGACPERRSQKIHPKDMSLTSYRGHRVLKTLIRCYFSPAVTTGQKYAYTGSADGSIHIYDLITGKVAEKLHHHTAVIRDVSWHPWLPIILSASWDCTVGYAQYEQKGYHRLPLN